MAKMKSIGMTEGTYNKLQAIQKDFEMEHKAKKTFERIILDLLEFKANHSKSE